MLKRCLVFLLLTAACVGAAEWVICTQCGYENPAHHTHCSNCQAPLPAASHDEAMPPAAPAPTATDRDMVDVEMAQGNREWTAGHRGVAVRLLRNALFLNRLGDDTDRGARILERLRLAEQAQRRQLRPCSVCGGTGRQQVERQLLDGNTAAIRSEGARCPACRGSGRVAHAGTIDEQKVRLGQSLRAYRELQQSRGYVAVGEAWMPSDTAAALTVRERARVMRAAAAPCNACMGLCREECDACEGLGSVACPNRGCRNGMIEVESDHLVKTRRDPTRPCPVCQGRARITCIACKGHGSIACSKCNGTGLRAPCRKCGGEGITPCRRCRGSGTYRDATCAECRGEGITLCKSCSGDGRKPGRR